MRDFIKLSNSLKEEYYNKEFNTYSDIYEFLKEVENILQETLKGIKEKDKLKSSEYNTWPGYFRGLQKTNESLDIKYEFNV